jgi:Ca2+/Na+ antiporter
MNLFAMLALTVAMFVVCMTGNRRVFRWEGLGLLLAYIGITTASIITASIIM